MSAVPAIRAARKQSQPASPPERRLRSVDNGASQPMPSVAPRKSGESAKTGSVSLLKAGADHREVCAIVQGTVQAALEVLSGTRPVNQLARRLDPRCLNALQQRAALIRRSRPGSSQSAPLLHRNPAVQSIRACEITSDVYEATAVVVDEMRARAVAVRLERSNRVWRVTVLEIG